MCYVGASVATWNLFGGRNDPGEMVPPIGACPRSQSGESDCQRLGLEARIVALPNPLSKPDLSVVSTSRILSERSATSAREGMPFPLYRRNRAISLRELFCRSIRLSDSSQSGEACRGEGGSPPGPRGRGRAEISDPSIGGDFLSELLNNSPCSLSLGLVSPTLFHSSQDLPHSAPMHQPPHHWKTR
jgi:hypothetical protein